MLSHRVDWRQIGGRVKFSLNFTLRGDFVVDYHYVPPGKHASRDLELGMPTYPITFPQHLTSSRFFNMPIETLNKLSPYFFILSPTCVFLV